MKMDEIQSVRTRSRFFRLSWKMCDACNYSCSYCYIKSKRDKPTQEFVEGIAEKIDSLGLRDIQLHLIGGEPTLYELVPVLGKISTAELRHVSVATNFSRPLEWWNELAGYLEGRNVALHIQASLHLEAGKPDEFVSKAAALRKYVVAKAVVSDSSLNSYLPYLIRLRDEGVEVEPTLERSPDDSYSMLSAGSQAVVDSFRRERKRIAVTLRDGSAMYFPSNSAFLNGIEDGHFNPDGFKCTAGMNNLRIDTNGDMLRAGCACCARSHRLGNILTDRYERPSEPIVCRLESGRYCSFCNHTDVSREEENGGADSGDTDGQA